MDELRTGEGLTAPFPARFGPGGEGDVGEKGEGAHCAPAGGLSWG